jgi:hypothetical protein
MKKIIIVILSILLVCFYSPQSPLDAAIERFQNRMEYRFSEEQLRFITYWSQELRLETEEDVYRFIVNTSAFCFVDNEYSREYIDNQYLKNGANDKM